MWSFLWSSSLVPVLLVNICSFLVPVCSEWRWISWTRNHVFHRGPAFSSLVFFLVSFWGNRCVFPLWGLLQVFLVLLYYCLSIQPFRHVFWLPYLSPKSFGFFGIRLLVCFHVTHSQLLMEFSFVVLECSVLSILFLPFVDISLISLLSPEPSGLFPQVVLLLFPVWSFPFCSRIYQRLSFVLSFWPVFVGFFYLRFQSNFPSCFDFFFVLFEGIPIFSQTNLAPA